MICISCVIQENYMSQKQGFLQKSTDYNPAWQRLRPILLERDNYQCARCGYDEFPVSLDEHHIIPRSQGGSNEEKNGITLCRNCHHAITHSLIEIKTLSDGTIKFWLTRKGIHSKELRMKQRLASNLIPTYEGEIV